MGYGRLSKGSRLQDAFPVPSPFPSLASLDSAFQLQEYIALLIRLDAHDVTRIVTIPGKSGDGGEDTDKAESVSSSDDGSATVVGGGEDEKGADEHCWIYEQLRRVAQDLAHPLLSTLQQECNRKTCPEMKADEWLYLCVAHGNAQGAVVESQCCAIDYIVHTLDSATALLNSPTSFPSRISIPAPSRRHFLSLARRLSRIFAHAYYHHREAFEQCEAETSLYSRFYLLSRKFDLVPPEFLVPPQSSPSSVAHLPPASADSRSSIHKPSGDGADPDFNRGTSQIQSTSEGTGASQNLEYDLNPRAEGSPDSRPPNRSRTDTMFLSSESLELALSAEKAKWERNLLNLPKKEDDEDEDEEEEDDDEGYGDDDGYDIVDGVSEGRTGRTGMVDEVDDVVVDELDGADASLTLDGTRSHVENAGENAKAVEAAATLPVLTSSSSSPPKGERPSVSVSLSGSGPALSPRRSPRRQDTIRQADVSPSLETKPELTEDDSKEVVPQVPSSKTESTPLSDPLTIRLPSSPTPPVTLAEPEVIEPHHEEEDHQHLEEVDLTESEL